MALFRHVHGRGGGCSESAKALGSKIGHLVRYSRHLREATKAATFLASSLFFIWLSVIQPHVRFATVLGVRFELGRSNADGMNSLGVAQGRKTGRKKIEISRKKISSERIDQRLVVISPSD